MGDINTSHTADIDRAAATIFIIENEVTRHRYFYTDIGIVVAPTKSGENTTV